MARALYPAEHLDDAVLGIGALSAAPRLHLLEVHPRAEGGTGAAHHHHPHVAVGVERLEEVAERGEEGGVHGIALPGTVEGDGGHAAVDGAEDFIGHGGSPGRARPARGRGWLRARGRAVARDRDRYSGAAGTRCRCRGRGTAARGHGWRQGCRARRTCRRAWREWPPPHRGGRRRPSDPTWVGALECAPAIL